MTMANDGWPCLMWRNDNHQAVKHSTGWVMGVALSFTSPQNHKVHQSPATLVGHCSFLGHQLGNHWYNECRFLMWNKGEIGRVWSLNVGNKLQYLCCLMSPVAVLPLSGPEPSSTQPAPRYSAAALHQCRGCGSGDAVLPVVTRGYWDSGGVRQQSCLSPGGKVHHASRWIMYFCSWLVYWNHVRLMMSAGSPLYLNI